MSKNRPWGVRLVGSAAVLVAALTVPAAPAVTQQASGRRPAAATFNLPGFREITALRSAYPDRIERIAVRDGEWALQVDGSWYSWADGRLLSDSQRADAELFTPYRFYNYTLGPPTQREISAELEARLYDRNRSFNNDGSTRYTGFADALYGVSSHAEADRTMIWVKFLGRPVQVHPMVERPLARVEERIRLAAETNSETAEFIRTIASIHGYHWREIAGTQRRSYHSYGVAVDFVPRSWGGRWGYWRWAYAAGIEEWWDIPLEQRWSVPQPVLDAFEAEGFIWGGKWLSFDPVHFEYRPEAILMARIQAAG